ncbi:uncharacterized protein LOC113227146 [Hyposmocoma kahamanoa]|uniref:uncharacterized protein LOC113227146 n=1 Tax=Hyposmocoma kahamanoa TaxID=1477025 RepID=UPI000E6D804F|nr:uncharacterized protein LOC113227146 [Hyposmocoma kahamanoa]
MVFLHRQYRLSMFVLFLTIECIISLQLLDLVVPSYVPLGTRAQLSCRWALGPADILYSVKWYKDGREFFRHVPRDLESFRKFQLPGVDVEVSDESGSNLTLTPAVPATEGRYRCEVSGEGPLFPTVSDHADLNVIVLPDYGPIITGFYPRYRLGERVRVTCTSGPSRPETTLAWYINGKPAPSSAITHFDEKYEDLQVTKMVLDFIVTEEYFRSNGFKVKCLATLPPIYWRSNEESAVREKKVYDKFIRIKEERGSKADRVLSKAIICNSLWQNVVIVSILCFKLC